MSEHSSLACQTAICELASRMGRIYGRVRIQKLIYFLKRLGASELGDVNFFYHHYGPFSWDVANGLIEAVGSGSLVEKAESLDDDRQKYEYMPGETGKVTPELSPESEALVEKLVNRVQREHWRTLELASTIDFLELSERVDRQVACVHALELKPHCKEFRQPALQLLVDLQLLA